MLKHILHFIKSENGVCVDWFNRREKGMPWSKGFKEGRGLGWVGDGGVDIF